jgi:hypothetical protein
MNELVKFDNRSDMFSKAMRFVNYELVEGDVIEFGVYSGRSLMLLSLAHEGFKDTTHGKITPERTFIGVDSFMGLPKNDHVRWSEGVFGVNHSWHPFISIGTVITPTCVIESFEKAKLPKPTIIQGVFNSENVTKQMEKIDKVSVIHIDCDLYESTYDALNLIKHKLQSGTIILFDDWFNYKADPNKGEQKAFNVFLKENPYITAIPYHNYSTFCTSFIIQLSLFQ